MATQVTKIRAIVNRFKNVRESWPVVESRIGRDLGQYIKGSYAARFKDDARAADSSADTMALLEREIVALERLEGDYFVKKYPRQHPNETFTGELGAKFGWAKLSTQSQKQQNSQSFLDRLFGRKIPSQHNSQTASKLK